MSQPLYFLPDRAAADLATADGRVHRGALAAVGLADTLADVATVEQLGMVPVTGNGPGGRSGVVICAQRADGAVPERVGFYPDCQEWSEHRGGALWIGLSTVSPVTPADLMRRGNRGGSGGTPRPPFAGHLVSLAGGEWEVPVIRRVGPAGWSALPTRLYWDDGGAFQQEIAPEYRAIWDETGAACNLLLDSIQGGQSVDLEWAVDLGLRALALNFRVDRLLQGRLGLIDSTNWQTVIEAMIDWPLVQAVADGIAKKNGAGDD